MSFWYLSAFFPVLAASAALPARFVLAAAAPAALAAPLAPSAAASVAWLVLLAPSAAASVALLVLLVVLAASSSFTPQRPSLGLGRGVLGGVWELCRVCGRWVWLSPCRGPGAC